MALGCSSVYLKRILILLIGFCVIVLMVGISRSAIHNSPSDNGVFETRTLSSNSSSVQDQLSGLQKAVKVLSSVVEDTVLNKDKPDPFGVNNTAFHEVLQQRASPDKLIVLASVDTGYVDLAINLYFTSLKKFGIKNYLFVGSDSEVCGALKVFDIACFDYIHDRDGMKSSGYFSQAFKRKTHLKTKIILEALGLGLKVLITDVDIVFLKNPIPLFNCDKCDIEISSDVVEGNSGFYLVKPTPVSIKLHTTAWSQGLAKPGISNQKAIDRSMEKMQKKKEMKVKNLNTKVYTNGKVYFEDGKRMFKGDNPCTKCVIVHNNWLVSSEAKIYRFKECGMWESNRNDYFSSEENKYISFELPGDYGAKTTLSGEIKAIQYAFILGAILNRIVILPQLHCYGCKFHPFCNKRDHRCAFGSFYKIDTFDAHLKGLYRESVFLSSDKVPQSVKTSLSPKYFINSALNIKQFPTVPEDVQKLTPSSRNGATVEELMQWLGNSTYSVLRFHSLYHGIDYDENIPRVSELLKKIKSGFVTSDYRQYKGASH